MVVELEEAVSLPEAKKVDYLYVKADGIFVRGTEKKKSLEVRHAIVHEGWDKNGKRIALRHPKVVMTTQQTSQFWKEVQAFTAHHYSLENTQVVTNSDGGLGVMESNQRHISFRMKKRGMHWSAEGGEAMVKVKQGILNGTLRPVYL